MKKLFACLLLLAATQLHAQSLEVYPANWWVGMKHRNIQLMLRDSTGLATTTTSVTSTNAALKVVKVHKPENNHYLFVDIAIAANAKPGIYTLNLTNTAKGQKQFSFQLKPRRSGNGTAYAQGVRSQDFVYLLMPDRFSNGDPSNDRVAGMRDQTLNRDSIYHRHGGDLQGVINHLDYLQSLGVTALWMTPVIENNMRNRTEHGYAFTNHYRIEPRFGGEAAYKKLSDALHQRGMKLVQDAVYNHVGLEHFTFRDKPMKDWYHEWPSFTQTTYKDQPLMDIHASAKDAKTMSDGWFVPSMPDLNQSNPFVANFLIQHAIWSVEEFGVDGWRIDTYIYNDLPFMNRCNQALLDEFPKITMFGETWVHGTANQAYFAANNINVPFKSNLIGVTDFQTNLYGINPALTQNFGWTEGVNKLYTTLSNDFLYKDATNNVNFLDNHDMTRFLTQVSDDVNKLKVGIAWLLTTRGIPQLYYGTEVLMKGSTHPHDGYVRLDFPGGWEGDVKNAFTQQGLTTAEQEMLTYTKTIGQFRKTSSALQTGKLMQYVPQDGLYVYFRYDGKQTIMCIMNTSDKEKKINFADYAERTKGFSKATDIISKTTYEQQFNIPAKQMWVLQLQ